MVHLIKKKIKGHVYCYLQHNIWVDGKPKRAWQIYLGPLERIQERGALSKPETLEFETVEFGADIALYDIAQKIQLVEVIDKYTTKKRHQGLTVGEYILLGVINRCINPCSKNKLGDWFKNSVLTKYFHITPDKLNSQTYWNHFQYFNEQIIEKIESELNKIILTRYHLGLDCVLYDPTNFYTYIQERAENELPRKGHSKEKRFDLNQVNLSLFCLKEGGVPLMHESYPGNTHDAKHFKKVIPKFIERMTELGKTIGEITLIFDKGNHSQDVFQDIKEAHLQFIASLRPSTQKELLEIPVEKFTPVTLQSTGKEVRYYRVTKNIYGAPRTVYVVYDPRHFKRAKLAFETRLQKKIRAVHAFFQDRLNIKKWRDAEKVKHKIRAILGKKLYGSVVQVELKGDFGHLELSLKINETEKQKRIAAMGKTILFTSCDGWDAELVIRTFREQYVIEDAFKHLKSPKMISIRPIYHYTDSSIRVHAFICVLGLLLLSLLRMELAKQGVYMSYFKTLEVLKTIKITRIFAQNNTLKLEKLNKLTPDQKTLFKILHLKRYVDG
ncbi:MAG: IS1634 family transposase [Candidatus Helarchaeota archaeon]